MAPAPRLGAEAARQLLNEVLRRRVTQETAAWFLEPLLTLLPRSDLDNQVLARHTALVLASQASTRGLFLQPPALQEADLLRWSDPADPAVRLLHHHLAFTLNTSLPLERSCCAILRHVLKRRRQSAWWLCHGERLQPLLRCLLRQMQRNGGLWPLDREAIGQLQVRLRSLGEGEGDGPGIWAMEEAPAQHPHGPPQPLLWGAEAVAPFYERHPYPRWDRIDRAPLPSLRQHLARVVGRAAAAAVGPEPQRVLVLGCGTGREAAAWASALPQAQVDAVDISAASLRCAAAMAHRLGLVNVHWHQHDLQALPPAFRTYDLVTACGVLHHLQDPWRGLATATQLLRPGGLLRIAFYSKTARRPIVQAREMLRARMGERVAGTDLARARAALLEDLPDHPELACLLRIQDFFDLDGCWDLFLNPCETCCTLPQLADQLEAAGLRFLGFDLIPAQRREQFRALFPTDPDGLNLSYWDRFEALFPDTFLGMYCLWSRLEPAGVESVRRSDLL